MESNQPRRFFEAVSVEISPVTKLYGSLPPYFNESFDAYELRPLPQVEGFELNEEEKKVIFDAPLNVWNTIEKTQSKLLSKHISIVVPLLSEIEKKNTLLKEIRLRLLYDIDEDGQPKSSMVDLLKMWEKVNLLIDKKK